MFYTLMAGLNPFLVQDSLFSAWYEAALYKFLFVFGPESICDYSLPVGALFSEIIVDFSGPSVPLGSSSGGDAG